MVVGLVFLVCVLSSASGTVSQTPTPTKTQLPNEIRIGIRVIVPPIGEYQELSDTYIGFCAEFGNLLGEKLGIEEENVIYKVIANEGKGSKYPRWASLLINEDKDKNIYRQDIQCGPNSSQPIDNDEIIFSMSNFYETGIKLFLKKDILDKYKPNLIGRINIGVLKETTASVQFKNRKNISEKDTRKEILKGLSSDKNPIQAFASDGIILRALLEQKDADGKSYKDKGYVLYPDGSNYLFDNSKNENYAIAISNKDKNKLYAQDLRNKTDEILNSQFKNEWKKKLENYEYYGTDCYDNGSFIYHVISGFLFVIFIFIIVINFFRVLLFRLANNERKRIKWKESLRDGSAVQFLIQECIIIGSQTMSDIFRVDQRKANNPFTNIVKDHAESQVTITQQQGQNLADAVEEIQEILNKLAQNYPSASENEIQTVLGMEVKQRIKNDPDLKHRFLNAAKQGGLELGKVLINHPVVNVTVEMIKGWLESEET
ncbi:hypothetical protein [Aerosakkonema funiforme]|uniref:hypothetical protein n=1 Tax=Aerosakkonema funiforme TaxID=1246630 RepID=UPI0035B7CCD8